MTNASLDAPAQPGATTVAPAIDIRGLSKSYGDVHAVRGLDLTIAPGEIVAMLGPNGAGKSTTNELILGMIKPDVGSVQVFGLDPVRAVRSGQVGAMLQAGALLQEASVKDVLRLMHGLHTHPLPLAEIIERADLASFLATKTDKLSGGQAQRLRYGLAIMPDPDLLILDEPDSGLDVTAALVLRHLVGNLAARGKAILYTSHILDVVERLCTRVIVLHEGRVVADDSVKQLRTLLASSSLEEVFAHLVLRQDPERIAKDIADVVTVGA